MKSTIIKIFCIAILIISPALTVLAGNHEIVKSGL